MARKSSVELPTLFDLSPFQVQPPQHPDDVDVEVAEWGREKPPVRSRAEACPKCKHFNPDGRFCWRYSIRFQPGTQLILEGVCVGFASGNFLCNSDDANNPETLHKKNDTDNFLCNSDDANNPELLHKKNDTDNFLLRVSMPPSSV